ncbi:hypothetical protein CANARDRAFT_29200 [[Candida] arabinofermentans NRRL YB-2248]|uniref:Uncharacterized protein n=1 Tax=[Candida] arabinofermentans NRRL YB-2248 TaxID=983967 RepID=A0A1E4SXU0_9ASCO|nr:hypothetical protein CANARDRAFT_29200 [[Candida] arabinofermentans NRRL YB-2248]
MSEFQYNKFLMFGDSITEFAFNEQPPACSDIQFTLGAALTNVYTRKLQVLQRGLSGYTTEWARYMLPKILKYEHDDKPQAEQIKIGYIFLGTNDARELGTANNAQTVPLPRYIENMEFLINEFTKRSIKVIVISPGLHDQEKWNLVHPEDLESGDYRSNELCEKYSESLSTLCTSLNVPMVNLYKVMSESNDYTIDELLTDGIHYTGKAYKLLYESLLSTIESSYPECHPDNIDLKFPLWSDVSIDKLQQL